MRRSDPLGDTRRWVERAVIGLNLCPFAKSVQAKGQVHYALSQAVDGRALLQDLARELDELIERNPLERDTTLLIAPELDLTFIEFAPLLKRADRVVRDQGFEGVIQIASFHPQYQFADASGEDIGNSTNRSPYPTLQLLREESVRRAVRAIPEASRIFEVNKATLRALGPRGWEMLDVGPHA